MTAKRGATDTAATQLVDRMLGELTVGLGNLKELYVGTTVALSALAIEMRASNERTLSEISKLRSTEIGDLRVEIGSMRVLVADQAAQLRVVEFKVEALARRVDDGSKSTSKAWTLVLTPVVAAIVSGAMALLLRHP